MRSMQDVSVGVARVLPLLVAAALAVILMAAPACVSDGGEETIADEDAEIEETRTVEPTRAVEPTKTPGPNETTYESRLADITQQLLTISSGIGLADNTIDDSPTTLEEAEAVAAMHLAVAEAASAFLAAEPAEAEFADVRQRLADAAGVYAEVYAGSLSIVQASSSLSEAQAQVQAALEERDFELEVSGHELEAIAGELGLDVTAVFFTWGTGVDTCFVNQLEMIDATEEERRPLASSKECPAGGEYSVDDGTVSCSHHGSPFVDQ